MKPSWLVRWLNPVDPIYRREITREKLVLFTRSKPRRLRAVLVIIVFFFILVLAGNAFFAFSGLLGVLFSVLSFFLFLVPLTLPALILILRVRVSLAISDVITYEIERQTWDTLRVLPYSIPEIVRSKYAGALIRARPMLNQILLLRIVLGFMAVLSALSGASEIAVTSIIFVVYYFFEPVLDFFIDGALGLAASAFASTRGQALMGGIAFGVAGMIVQFFLNIFLSIPIFDPEPGACVAVVLILIVLRYAAVRGLLALAMWRAGRI